MLLAQTTPHESVLGANRVNAGGADSAYLAVHVLLIPGGVETSTRSHASALQSPTVIATFAKVGIPKVEDRGTRLPANGSHVGPADPSPSKDEYNGP